MSAPTMFSYGLRSKCADLSDLLLSIALLFRPVPCTSLHGIGADEVMVSGHLPLAVGDFKWADAVTVHAHRV